MTDTREARIAHALAELEARVAAEDSAEALLSRRRRVPGTTTVYSLRLDCEEVAALEVQAAARGLKPSVLARNLIRVGLRAPHDDALGAAVSCVHDALAEVSSLLGR